MGNDLERLRREGAARLEEADRAERARQDERANERLEQERDNVRLAVGRYRYRTLRTWVYRVTVVGLPVFALALMGAVFDLTSGIGLASLPISIGWLFGGLWLWASEIVWRASKSAMREERKWVETRPFAINGYFEWLAESDDKSASLRLEIRGPGIAGRREDLRTLVAAVHPHVTIENAARGDGAAHLRLTSIPGREDDQRARLVHDLVDGVLVALHHESPLEGLKLAE